MSGQREQGDGEFIWDPLNLRCLWASEGGSRQAAGNMEGRLGVKTQLGLTGM